MPKVITVAWPSYSKTLLIYTTFHIQRALIDTIYNLPVSDKDTSYLKYKVGNVTAGGEGLAGAQGGPGCGG